MTRLSKIQRRALEEGANLTEHDDGWYWDLDSALGVGPFATADECARDYLNKIGVVLNILERIG